MFTGSIHEDARGVVLGGRFAVKRWAIVNRNMSLIFATFGAVVFTLAALTQLRTMWPVPFIAAVTLTLLYGQAQFACRRARDDVAWLTHRIEHTIGNPVEWPEPPPPPAGWLRRRFAALSGQ